MIDFNSYINEIESIQEEKAKGIIHHLPIPQRLSKLDNLLAGIGKRDNIIITGGTGSAKSTFMRDIVDNYIHDLIQHPDTGDFKIKIFVNALEESVKDMAHIKVIRKVYEKYGIDIKRHELEGRTLTGLSRSVMDKITDAVKEIQSEEIKYSDHINVEYLSEGNPFGFYKRVRQYARDNGTFYLEGKPVDFEKNPKSTYDKYIPNDPNELVICISDHIGLYTKEDPMNWYDTMQKFAQEYSRKYINLKFGYAIVHIQQQALQTEDKLYDRRGNLIVPSTFPSRSGFGKIKITSQDSTVILGLWNPHLHNVHNYFFGDIEYPFTDLKNAGYPCRVVFVLKNRYGGAEGDSLPCWIDFKTSKYYQLPDTEEGIRELLNNPRT